MVSYCSPFLRINFTTFTLFFFFVAVQSLIPANRTLRIVNEGDFSDYIVEYDANYRPVSGQTDIYQLYNYPFYLSFYNTTPNAYILAIRAGLPRDEDLMRWVWDANRNSPVGENATLSLGRDGNLVLAEADGRVKWQTNTANKGVDGITLLDNGNLVLYDKKGRFVWQSFDHPSDTLLIGMSLNINGRNKLVSRTSDADPSDGPYSMVLEKAGNLNMYLNSSGQRFLYGGWTESNFGSNVTFDLEKLESYRYPNSTAYEVGWRYEPYSSPPPSRRRLLQSRPTTTGNLLNLVKLNYNATLSFLRLGSDGNLKAYTFYLPVDYLKWAETYAFFSDSVRECGLPSKCGKFGYCSQRMCVGCPSPEGILGWSESCAPPKLPACKGGAGAAARYYKIVGVEHFMSPYMEGEGPMKVEECRRKCDKDCKCVGFIHKEDTSRCLRVPLLATLIKVANTSVGYIKY